MTPEQLLSQFIEMVAQRTAEIITEKQPLKKAVSLRVRLDGIQGLAEHLGCAKGTAQRLRNDGKFPAYRVGSRVFFYSDEVDAGVRDI